jgi:hypothetical protein
LFLPIIAILSLQQRDEGEIVSAGGEVGGREEGEMTQTLYAHTNKRKKKTLLKNPSQKRVGEVAQGVGPEFKPQHRQLKKKKNPNSNDLSY